MKKITVSILTTLLMLSMVFSSSVFAANEEVSAWDSFLGLFSAKTSADEVGVEYRGHIENKGDFPLDNSWIQGPAELGTRGESLRMEGFWIQLTDAPDGMNIKYNVHVQNVGWLEDEDDTTEWIENGDFCGTRGYGYRIEAVKIVLVDDEGNLSTDYDVMYQGHVQNVGDLPADGTWYENGEKLGTVGASQRLEALKVKIVQKEADLDAYEAALAAVTQADYTAASWTAYQAVVAANVVDEDNLQSEVDAATAAITAAQANLVKVLKVESVSAINASQVQVVFNGPVSKDSAELTTNYLANNVTVSNASSIFGGTGTTAKLQADGKTVIIEAPQGGNFIANGSSFTLKVKNVKATDGINTAPEASFVVTLNDAVGPVVQTATAAAGTTTTKSVKVTFNEPVKDLGAYTVAGQAAVAAINAKDTKVVDLTTNQALTAGQAYTLVITGVGDGVNTSAAQSITFTVSSDVTAPVITSVTQLGGQLAVTFDKEISASDLSGLLIGNNVTTDSITLAKTGSTTPYTTTANLDPDDKHIVLLDIVSTVYGTSSTATAELKVSNVKDVNGNKMAEYKQTVSLIKDTTKPTLVSSKMSTATTREIILEFSEAVDSTGITAVTVINNSTGVDVTPTYGASVTTTLVKADGTPVEVGVLSSKYAKLTMAAALPAATYTITIPADVVVDTSNNKMAQTQFSVTANTSQDSTKPTVTSATNSGAGQNVITVVFSENVQLADARNTANYILAGNALPAATEIVNVSSSSTDTDTFEIRIPNDGITADNVAASFVVSSVKDLAGNVMNTQTISPALSIRDTKAPTLVSAKATATTTLELTFSEPVAIGGTPANAVTVGGVTVATLTGKTDIVGSKATITTTTMGGVDFTTANLTMIADAFVDLAGVPNSNTAIVAGDGIKVTDKFVDVIGGVVATTGSPSPLTAATDILVDITAPTNSLVDKVAQYDIYVTSAMATPYDKVSDVEALTKLATFGPANAGAAKALPATAGSVLSDGITIAGFTGNVTTYIVVVDEAGNKALITEASAAL